ncbi:Lrp/AsnC family transcriptional regulator [Roseovarius aestuarii]|uniref:Leucine-responsive regulatory protein n=2 Tax=Roseovarius aestuarii TaxID=475083 RepID=A0A1X7BV69_9RHOB|nr:Lrp/AsnC family transcriptional regulator [Roseovarius aestuarii]SMC13561.1 Leucine-responsive regulatory protein [Roseovarius aestuarii]
MKNVDKIDRLILRALEDNADCANKLLAERVGLSPSACLRRVARLKEIGAIKKIVAVVDPDCYERKLSVVVSVKFERHGLQARQNFFDQLKRERAVVQCYMVTGEVGSIIILHVADMDEYTELTDRLFNEDPNISAFTTFMVMSKLL